LTRQYPRPPLLPTRQALWSSQILCSQASLASLMLAPAILRHDEVRAPAGAVRQRQAPLHAVDLQCASAWILDPVWLFSGWFRYDDVKRALEWLVTVFPEVGGRMTAHGILVRNQGKPAKRVESDAMLPLGLQADFGDLSRRVALRGPHSARACVCRRRHARARRVCLGLCCTRRGRASAGRAHRPARRRRHCPLAGAHHDGRWPVGGR